MKTTLISLFTLICLNLHSQVKTIVMEEYSTLEIPSEMQFNEALTSNSIKNSTYYLHKMTYEFDFDKKTISMWDEENWKSKGKIVTVNYIEPEHFELVGEINEQLFIFQLCKNSRQTKSVILCYEFQHERSFRKVVISDVLTCITK